MSTNKTEKNLRYFSLDRYNLYVYLFLLVRVVGNASQEQKMELEQQAKRRNSQTDQDQLIPEVPGTVPTACPTPIF
jgi:hypothetical protein